MATRKARTTTRVTPQPGGPSASALSGTVGRGARGGWPQSKDYRNNTSSAEAYTYTGNPPPIKPRTKGRSGPTSGSLAMTGGLKAKTVRQGKQRAQKKRGKA